MPQWALALRWLDPPINLYSIYHAPYGLPIDKARTECVEFALKQDCEYLFFLGDDTVPPADALHKMVFILKNNKWIDVVGAVYCSKSTPAAPLVFRGNGRGTYWDWKVGELFWVTGTGLDCCLIRTSVFDRLEKPWFLEIRADAFMDEVARAEGWTEDLYFYDKLMRSYGWTSDELQNPETCDKPKTIWVDASIQCEHFDVKTGMGYKLPLDSIPSRRLLTEGSKEILELGCGPEGHFLQDGVSIKLDMDERLRPNFRGDPRVLPFATETFDVVFVNQIIERYTYEELDQAVAEWLRVLRVGGELRVMATDAQALSNGDGQPDLKKLFDGVRKSAFNIALLEHLLAAHGVEIKRVWTEPPSALYAEATKTKAREFVGEGQGRAILKSEVPEENLITDGQETVLDGQVPV
jgi:SAM-dependent methyltransferase